LHRKGMACNPPLALQTIKLNGADINIGKFLCHSRNRTGMGRTLKPSGLALWTVLFTCGTLIAVLCELGCLHRQVLRVGLLFYP